MATDGILETLFPLYIRSEPVNIHIALAQFFMDNTKLRIHKRGKNVVRDKIEDFIKNIPEEQVNDDKTVVVMINTASKTKSQPADYYKEPDWAELKRKHDEEWQRLAYPHLFAEKQTEVSKSDVEANDSDAPSNTNDKEQASSNINNNPTHSLNKPDDEEESKPKSKKKGWLLSLWP